MNKLLEAADQQASSAVSTAEFDESLFRQFMKTNRIWDFHDKIVIIIMMMK